MRPFLHIAKNILSFFPQKAVDQCYANTHVDTQKEEYINFSG